MITFDTGVGKDDKRKIYTHLLRKEQVKEVLGRLYQARKYKLWATLEILKEYKYCPIEDASLKRWKDYNKEEAQKGI